MLHGLDLFSGIGGISVALSPWVRTLAYCERDRYAQAVLLSRMRSGHIDRAPIWDDVETLQGKDLPRIDIIFGGFPCQDISVAGRGDGLEGKRSGLFFQIIRLIKETEPLFVFLENVPAIRTRGGETVGKELARLGYDCRWVTLSAAEVGANHIRKRWFLLAHPHGARIREQLERMSEGWPQRVQGKGEAKSFDDGEKESVADPHSFRKPSEAEVGNQSRDRALDGRQDVANDHGIRSEQRIEAPEIWERQPDPDRSCIQDAERIRLEKQREKKTGSTDHASDTSWWTTEPDVGRVAHGVPFRVDRIRCLGNAVVPLQARTAFERLIGFADI